MEFVALDVETANAESSSICQIGIARFEDDCLTEEWSTLVNPEDYFDSCFPMFPQLVAEIRCRVRNRIVLSHTPFDRVANLAIAVKDASRIFLMKLSGTDATGVEAATVSARRMAALGFALPIKL